ncbi:MAG: ATP-dependent DNA helicase RecG [Candidatus Avoscillospira sp.]
MDLDSPVTALAGIGPSRAKQLQGLGIETVYDLIAYFPRAYEDRTRVVPICQLEAEQPACFRAWVIREPRTSYIRKGLSLTKLTVADNTGRLNLTYFNQPYVAEQLHYGEEYFFYGTVVGDFAGYQMQNPTYESVTKPGVATRRIMPIYALTAGISNKLLSRCIQQALDACFQDLPELLPASVRNRHDLCSAQEAYVSIHAPESFEALDRARKRLVFEEFFIFSAGLQLMRSRRRVQHTAPYDMLDLTDIYAALPFQLTGAQRRAIQEITADLQRGVPMNRLLQGDVGSGKTMVAAAACYLAAQNRRQAAFMAPTEILAEQHFQSLSPLLEQFGITAALLTGSLPQSEKRRVKAGLADGSIQLVLGTHALLTADVAFQDLDLVIADEQHRFGVAQRAALSEKGRCPHLLVMSATPIPRTLALMVYGDLDVSVLDELPPGRQTIDTFLVGESMRPRINAFIRKHAEAGNQVYVVCPAVEESDLDSLKSAEVWAETLQRAVFPDLRVGLLHGKLKGADKDRVMAAFASHELDILVATTVIEVGVDVPNATLMVIENADRFGLSQLHQLRGRVGRGKDKSYCVLFTSNKNPETLARLKALCGTNDGFKIAEQDLALRGPGDFFGSRQHGLPQFKAASLTLDMTVLKEAQEEAESVLSDPDFVHDPVFPALQKRIQALFSKEMNIFN